MKGNTIIIQFFIFLLIGMSLSTLTVAHEHYTFEHSEEMRLSGKIEWRDYGPDAFAESIAENKPIFLMLTAPTWCYWCHVYTSDDYVYHNSIAPIINSKFIPIYVNADHRQDLTRQYLEGGWPSTTVFTPSRERLFGFSGPRPHAWMIQNLNNAAAHVEQQGFANTPGPRYEITPSRLPTNDELNTVENSFAGYIVNTFDSEHGGFGTGQKFPQGRTLDFSLELYEKTGQQRWLNIVITTLRNQYTDENELDTNYNLFDPLDGGFHRYGVERDWSPPHYEKMLYDNARLLKAYAHLRQIQPDDPLTNEVVDKTLAFIDTYWYDHEHGGFYGNSDVHGEDAYYGKNPRSEDKPRVETTIYSDWNSDAIITYLYLFELTENKEYKSMVEQTLDYFSIHMIDENGAFHYRTIEGERGVQGTLLDNSYLLLAFVEAYRVLGEKKYLDTAKTIAEFSLAKLYDWYGGRFFDRHSNDLELYAPGEHIRLAVPQQENGIMSYAMLRMYQETQDLRYLTSGLKSLGRSIDGLPGHDRGYYYVKAAQLARDEGLLNKWNEHSQEIQQIEQEQQASFWGLELQAPTVFAVDNTDLPKLQGSLLILIIVAFLAGLLSFLSPCTLPIVPAFVAQALQAPKRNVQGMTLFFVLGLVFLFTLIGMTASFIGLSLQNLGEGFFQFTGVLIIVIGLFIALGKGLKSLPLKIRKPTGYTSSFVFGAVMGLSWTPCEGFILVALLLLASATETAISGGLLLFFYGLGLSLPIIFVGRYLRKIDTSSRLWKLIQGKTWTVSLGNKTLHLHSTSLISGVLFIILGILIFSGLLFSFNQYVASSGLQQLLFSIEEVLLGWVS